MTGFPWSRNQDEALRAGWGNGRVSIDDVVDVLMITRAAAHGRVRKLNLPGKVITNYPRKITMNNDDGVTVILNGDDRQVRLDAADLDWFLAYPGGWFVHKGRGVPYVYASSKPNSKLHRLLIGAAPGKLVDHRDRNGLNNRRNNLRIATPSQNVHNSGPQKQVMSGFKCVWLHRSGLYYGAVTAPDGKRYCTGYYDTAYAAAQAHDAVALAFHGEFAYANLPDDRMPLEFVRAGQQLRAVLLEAGHSAVKHERRTYLPRRGVSEVA